MLECTSVSFPDLLEIIFRKPQPPVSKITGVEKFSSEQEFKDYIEETGLGYYESFGLGEARMMDISEEIFAPTSELLAGKGGGPERVSTTTVQVLGIDEPDIVKTDGKEIYFSSGRQYYWRPFLEIIPPQTSGETKIIRAFPVTNLKLEEKIKKSGELLLHEDILVIFSGDEITGYDISNPNQPEQKWEIELESNNYVVGARLHKGKIYLITSTRINTYNPCPIRPLSVNGAPLEIKCVDIYHPVPPIPVDTTYNALICNPESGDIEKNISFIGTSGSSVVYMSENGLYITYSYYESLIKFFIDFFAEECKDIIPSWIIEKLEKLESYDISETAKFTEFGVIMEQYHSSLSDDEKLRIENEFQNRIEDYYKDNKRELETTGIVKVDLDNFEVSATGGVPGRPLNQFSLDEYNNHLRIATTVGEGMFWGRSGTGASANDVYVLDGSLKTVGFIQDLGLEERIYSARFIEDKGYLVTFRQIDPFFVLDLSDPENPELKGELKIPGYSSYLHPITKDKILGIGKEDSKVKISLFDVSNPKNPIEKAKYTLDECWSDILNTHHAFLLDEKHKIFFLPGSRGGYIFSYAGDQLKLERAVSNVSAKRAIYIDDYLYIIGEREIVVLNEINWKEVNELDFNSIE